MAYINAASRDELWDVVRAELDSRVGYPTHPGGNVAKLATAAGGLDELLGVGKAPEIGSKLEYFLGRTTASAHNIERSQEMLRQLERIGLPDNAATRQLLTDLLARTLRDQSNIARIQANGRVVRDALLSGPGGFLKFETIWEGAKLITGNLFGKG